LTERISFGSLLKNKVISQLSSSTLTPFSSSTLLLGSPFKKTKLYACES